MKYAYHLFLFGLTFTILSCLQGDPHHTAQPSLVTSAIKWHDSLQRHLPKNMDTTIVVHDAIGNQLKFHQYIKAVFNHEAILYMDKGVWKLHRLTKTAKDSLERDDHAIARIDRAMAYRTRDTISSWQTKLNAIAQTLAQADHIMVFKRERLMIVKRKGVKVLSFKINLGWSPKGQKKFDGDGKTPEGTYYIDLKQSRSDNLYKSFWISYPNASEILIAKQQGLKPGVGIMIHGTPTAKIRSKDWTNGCIGLQNKDLDTLFKHVGNGAVIEINK